MTQLSLHAASKHMYELRGAGDGSLQQVQTYSDGYAEHRQYDRRSVSLLLASWLVLIATAQRKFATCKRKIFESPLTQLTVNHAAGVAGVHGCLSCSTEQWQVHLTCYVHACLGSILLVHFSSLTGRHIWYNKHCS